MTATIEQQALKVSMAPPRRLMQPGRFRSFKTRDDHDVWDTATEAVAALLAQGWQVVEVVVDWQGREPLLPRERERQARVLTHCEPIVCRYGEVRETRGGQGRGYTIFTLERERDRG